MTKEYTRELQQLFLEMMLQDAENYIRVQNIYNPDNFDRSLREVAAFIKEHTDNHNTLPGYEQVKATTGVVLQSIPELKDGQSDWFLSEFEGFTKRQELERAILKSVDLIEKGEFDPVEKLIKDAVQISLQKDMGTDYFADPKSRLEKYFNNGYKVSTGWPSLDSILYGGFSRGELNIFAGGSGSGKSLFMMNIALNWLGTGLNGAYISLELSEGLSSLRTDAMLSNMGTSDIRKNMDDAVMKINSVRRKCGKYQIKALPAQSNVNDIRSFVKEYEIKSGTKLDFMMVDYLDLLMPVSAKVSASDLFVKDKYVSEELRNLAEELDILFVTASQLNRSAVEEVEFDHSHISGGISKINTADNVFGIFTSRQMKERGRYQIQCMKNRSGGGTGKKVDLEYNIETMRITDPGPEGQESYRPAGGPAKVNIMDQIKAGPTDEAPPTTWKKPTGTPAWEQALVTGEVQSAKLKSMLAGLKSKSE